MSPFFSFLKTKKIPSREDITLLSESPVTLYKVFIGILIVSIIGTTLSLLLHLSKRVSYEIPDYGGTLKEGVIGAPRFINPFLATTDTDTLLSTLTFSGLVTKNPDGTIVPALASSFSVAPDGLTAQFTLPDHLAFSDGTPITSSDVVFSFSTYKALEKNFSEGSWNTISVEAPDSNTVVLKTTDPRTPLLLYATSPIAPRHIWEPIPLASFRDSTNNMNPVGSGPFKLSSITYKNTLPQVITLKRNPHGVSKKPYMDTIDVVIFANQLAVQSALKDGSITSTIALEPQLVDTFLQEKFSIWPIPSPTTISLLHAGSFSEQTKIVLKTISPLIDRTRIIDTIENGYGIPLADTTTTSDSVYSGLDRLGYKKDTNGILTKQGVPVRVSIALRKDDALMHTATILAEELERLGVSTEIKVFDQGAFIDALRQQSFPLLLEKTDTTVPGYNTLIPLYRKTMLHTAIPSILAEKSDHVQTKEHYWASIPSWPLVTDTVWKWFTKQ